MDLYFSKFNFYVCRSLGIGFLQQGNPECSGGMAAREAELASDAGQPVVDGYLCPVAVLPEAEEEGAPVGPLPPLGLAGGHHLGTGGARGHTGVAGLLSGLEETMEWAFYLAHQMLVLQQHGAGTEEPAVSQPALLRVALVGVVGEERGRRTDLLDVQRDEEKTIGEEKGSDRHRYNDY